MAGREQSIWTKQITFRRKKDDDHSDPFPEPEPRRGRPSVPSEYAPPSPKPAMDPSLPPVSSRFQSQVGGLEEPGPAAAVNEPVVPADPPAVEPTLALAPVEDAPPAGTDTTATEPDVQEPGQPSRGIARPSLSGRTAGKRARKPFQESRESGHKRHKSLVGLKVGASQLSAAHVLNSGSPRVVQVATDPLAPGLVVGGEVRRPDELAEALKTFFRKHKLPRSPIRLGIANNRIGVRVLELSGIQDPKQLGNAVRFRAQEVLPIALEEAVLDYRVLRQETGPEGELIHKVLLVVAHRELVEGYASACRKAGLKLAGIDLEAFALLRALTPQNDELGSAEDAALVVVSIGYDRSTLAVSDGRICEFSRVLEWGGSVLDAAVAHALDLPAAEAEPVRLSVTLADLRAVPPWITADDALKARTAMRAEVQAFARDLVASLRFYQEQPDSLGIARIVLTGGCAQLEGLDAELSSLIGVDCKVGHPFTRVKTGRKIGKQAPTPSLTAAIGLGIED